MKNFMVKLILVNFFIFSPISMGDQFYWLVNDLNSIKIKNTSASNKILLNIPKSSIIEIPSKWIPSLCDFDKSIAIYEDRIGAKITACSFSGVVRGY